MVEITNITTFLTKIYAFWGKKHSKLGRPGEGYKCTFVKFDHKWFQCTSFISHIYSCLINLIPQNIK